MNNFPNAKTFNLIIPANSQQSISFHGNSITPISSTGNFKVAFNGGTSEIELQNGISYSCDDGVYFDNVTFKNENGVAITVTIFLGSGNIRDARLNISGGITITSSISAPLFIKDVGSSIVASPDVVCAATSQTNIGGGSVTNRKALIKNPSSSAGSVRIGGNTTGATTGYELEAGEGKEFSFTGNIYAYNPNSASVNLSITYIRD